ncbi:hypothetical protein [Roseibium sp. MMSF_3412]|uniref:hypothetical protein n=1 Tax=Roseibium sp. MMSF_3412 TaxID=3046712 RepID=UPI00273E2BB2|nr:hypothetical protein [Roseibium sp. MMSF_3412]
MTKIHRHTRMAAILAITGLSLLSATAVASDWTYMDDRSSPQKLVESYYFAIGNRNYAQAYSYFKPDTALQNFEKWLSGYAKTQSVSVKFGSTEPDPGAGQIYWALPVVIEAVQSDGTSLVYTGCYKIHMTNPGMQTDPPYQPMAIESASLKKSDSPYKDAKPGSC